MNESELRKQMIENAQQAGYYKGLLEGIMCQATDVGEYYRISAEVFKKVENALKEFDDKLFRKGD